MDNQLYIFDVTNGWPNVGTENKDMVLLNKALNEGYEIKRCYTTDNVFIFHIAEVEEEIEDVEPMVESVIEIPLDDNPETIKEWTDEGWTVKTYYSKKVQLVKMKETEKIESS